MKFIENSSEVRVFAYAIKMVLEARYLYRTSVEQFFANPDVKYIKKILFCYVITYIK